MSIFTRLSNGWQISMQSFRLLKANKELIIFPILSGASLIIVIVSFAAGVFALSNWNVNNLHLGGNLARYAFLFAFYLVNYFVIVFFNMALVHCVRLHLQGEEVSLRTGIQFSISRIGVIFSWAVLAATVGTILKVIQENSGSIGKIITGIIGIVWNIATFFVVPILAYENLGPVQAVKRSMQIMKEKWGESLSGNFSLGLVQFIGILIISLPLFFLGALITPILGILLAVLSAFIIISIVSAAQMIFISTVYNNITGTETNEIDQQMIDGLFVYKNKKSFF